MSDRYAITDTQTITASPGDTVLLLDQTQTGDTLTETSTDPDAPAPLLEGTGNHTTEPTYTANSELLDVGVNSRATFRWASAPGGELMIPATDNAGLGLTAIGSGGTDHAATIHWIE